MRENKRKRENVREELVVFPGEAVVNMIVIFILQIEEVTYQSVL